MSTSFRKLLDFLSAVLKLREPLNFCWPFQDRSKTQLHQTVKPNHGP